MTMQQDLSSTWWAAPMLTMIDDIMYLLCTGRIYGLLLVHHSTIEWTHTQSLQCTNSMPMQQESDFLRWSSASMLSMISNQYVRVVYRQKA